MFLVRSVSRLGGALVVGLLAGGLHALSLRMPWGWLLAWIALVPLLRIAAAGERDRTVVATIAYALTLGQADVTPWLAAALERYFALTPRHALAFAIGGMTLLASAYGAVLAAALVARRRASPRLGVLWCAATWSLWESLRTLVPPWLPSCMVALSQVDVTPVLQVASLAGITAVTALVVAANAALAELVDARRVRSAAAVAVVVAVVLAWGSWRARAIAASDDVVASVVLVDGAAPTAAESTLTRYIAATPPPSDLPALTDPPPSFVVWPESALDVDLTRDRATWVQLAAFVEALGIPLVTGGIGSAIDDDGEPVRFNAVHFLEPRHGIRSYYKRWLMPLAESWPAVLGPAPPPLAPVTAGQKLMVFGDDAWRFGLLVCNEITDGGAARRLAALGARVLLSISNDVWFGDREAPHVVWARIRAVESGLPVVRAGNQGTSAVIDPAGRYRAVRRRTGAPSFLAATVPSGVTTVYLRTGEVFLPVCLVVVLVGLFPRRRAG